MTQPIDNLTKLKNSLHSLSYALKTLQIAPDCLLLTLPVREWQKLKNELETSPNANAAKFYISVDDTTFQLGAMTFKVQHET